MARVTCGFIGLGLIGGSIARALKDSGEDIRTVAYDTDRESLTQAYRDGTVDVLLSEIGPGFSSCDYVFLCASVEANAENAGKVGPFLSWDAVLTDVGSVKTGMHRRMEELGLGDRFIGGHPMAGSERTGYRNSKSKLLQNAYYIITVYPGTDGDRLEGYRGLVRTMGAIPLVMGYEHHDAVTAAVSHVPHVISASLVNLVRASDSPEGEMRMIAAGGFKDITRISSSSPDMWRNICLDNAGNISGLLGEYISSLQDVRKAIDSGDGDGIRMFFDTARRYRDTFADASSGPIKTDNSIHVEIPDETGALAVVMTMLAAGGIDVKNVGIVHNREFETGSLRVELHDETDVGKAERILSGHGYQVTVGRYRLIVPRHTGTHAGSRPLPSGRIR